MSGALIPACWPVADGACGCGQGHVEKDIGKAPLVAWRPYVVTPPTTADLARWRASYPTANWAALLEPLGALEVDLDSDDALSEATAYGLPPAPVMKTCKGRRYRYRAPAEVAGRRVTRRGASRSIDVLAGGYVIIEGRHRLGPPYQWIVSPAECPLDDAPKWAVEMLLASGGATATTAVRLPADLPAVDLDDLEVHPRIKQVIVEGGGPTYPSRSEAVFAVALELIGAGYDDGVIAAILRDERYGISEKPREHKEGWLASEIARARRKRPVLVIR